MARKPFFSRSAKRKAADGGDGPGSHDVGAELRQARRRKGVDLATAARDLKLRDDYLKALEQNDHGALPGLPYAAGFVRSYATYLGLDAEDLVVRFKGDTTELQVRQDYAWLTPIQEGRVSGGLVFILSLVLAGGAYAGWYYQTLEDRRPAVAADAVLKQDVTPVIAAAAGAAREVPKTAQADRSANRNTLPRGGASGQSPDGQAGGATPEVPRLDTGAEPMDVRVGEDRQTPEKKQAVAAATADQTVTLKALGYVWLRVRNPQTRRVIAEKIMQKGETMVLPREQGLVLDVGRANQVEILVGNKSMGLAGDSVRPRRNVSLDPSQLKQDG